MENLFMFVAGVLLGAAVVLIVYALRGKESRELARELVSETESQKVRDLETIIDNIKDSFGSLSLEALGKNTQEFLKLANETLSKQTEMGDKELEGKKKLIDQTLEVMREDLQGVQALVTRLEKDREQKFGELANQLRSTSEETKKLQETAGHLRAALASTKIRGQWGERMAEDVLKLAGFIEGINYIKQKALETVSSRPDYTFLLPQDLKVNMDVKFPLNNYLRFLEAEGERDKESYKGQFLKDVKQRIKEVTTRDYINPEENTVDYVIVFIPNEQVYAFINEHDRDLLDDAMKNKVILCSPITLYAILAVIRQAVDNFNLEKTAAQIMSLLRAFQKQWDAFVASMEKMGKRIDDAQKEYNALVSTRRNQLERPLRQIETLRQQESISDEPTVAD
jgi:DNA recombination protein RmuC